MVLGNVLSDEGENSDDSDEGDKSHDSDEGGEGKE